MEQNKRYEAPKMEVIELDTFSVVCVSEDPVIFNGTVMNFSRGDGQW